MKLGVRDAFAVTLESSRGPDPRLWKLLHRATKGGLTNSSGQGGARPRRTTGGAGVRAAAARRRAG